MLKRILAVFFIVALATIVAIADPNCKLGKSLSMVQAEIPNLNHLRNWPNQGDQYIVYHESGVSSSYYFKNGRVVKEVFSINKSYDDALYYYNRFVSDFSTQNYRSVQKSSQGIIFYFSKTKVVVSLDQFVGNEYLCKVIYTPY